MFNFNVLVGTRRPKIFGINQKLSNAVSLQTIKQINVLLGTRRPKIVKCRVPTDDQID
ncbi:hypothetical protein [Microseira wollei]|uniref:Uncharacterized protein n=1 Tax=Microseira wollei NIES-4236 TaxID=2530354 RepID=A0AAV3XUI9_9CYAN|nr:hypothetical protein [Microseira wollei]GET44262.1 hypothetical protein MiSe_90880 [Microseira wollei NIES-4236]